MALCGLQPFLAPNLSFLAPKSFPTCAILRPLTLRRFFGQVSTAAFNVLLFFLDPIRGGW